ncbi:MAG: NrfD/PsrC family molybdoenzyme membrane anchor subunit [Acidimicrobiales bacterium]
MAKEKPLLLGRSQFRIGYQPQGQWSWLITAAFLLGSVGAGLFLISYFSGFRMGAGIGLLIVGVGKTTAHLLYLGRPERFLRVITRWRTSWLARGAIAMVGFVAFGALYLARYLHMSFVPHGVTVGFGAAAVVLALVIMCYDGFVMKASRGIPLWDTYLMPVLVFFYALLGGTTLALVTEHLAGVAAHSRLEWLEIALLLLNSVLIGVVLFTAKARQAAVKAAVALLTRGPLKPLFFGVAVGLGIGGTILLVGISIATGSVVALVIGAATELLGDFFVVFSLLRVGLHPTIRSLPERRIPVAVGA